MWKKNCCGFNKKDFKTVEKMKIRIGFILISFFLLIACEDDKAPSGVDLTVYYSDSLCQSLQPNNKEFNGTIYFIPENNFYSMDTSLWDSVKNNYSNVKCTDGYAGKLLEPGNYYVKTDSVYYYSNQKIEIVKDKLLEIEISFCVTL